MILYLCCDDQLNLRGKLAAQKALSDAALYLPELQAVDLENRPWTPRSPVRGETCLTGCRRESGQYDASRIINNLTENLSVLPGPAKILLVTVRDLTMGTMKFCFGAGRLGGRGAVVSVARFLSLSPVEFDHCLSRSVRHEIGHMLTMAADRNRSGTEQSNGPHCTNPGCIMRQTLTLTALRNTASDREVFCPQCLADMRRHLQAAAK